MQHEFFVIPTRITVGGDGVELRWLWQKRILRYRELARRRLYRQGRYRAQARLARKYR